MSFKAGNPAYDVLIRAYVELVQDVLDHGAVGFQTTIHDTEENQKKVIRSLREAVDGDEYLKVFFDPSEVEKAVMHECPVCGDQCSVEVACKGCNLVWEVEA